MKKSETIKHKLWGKLKQQAHDTFRVIAFDDCEYYGIEYWCVDEYRSLDDNFYTLEDVTKEIEFWRNKEFERLCYKVLYERRKKIAENI